jgi:Putative zinc-finger
MPESIHLDVAAYALGGLDQHEDEAFRNHLDGCPTCWTELERMVDVTSLLSRLDPQDVFGEQERPRPEVLDGLLRDVRATRRSTRYRVLAAAAAAVALIVAGPIVASSIGSGDKPSTPVVAAPAPVLPGKIFTATSATTGATARVGLEEKGWGTNIGLELGGIRGPLTCELVAVSRSGDRQTVTTWSVPPKGYGVPGSPAPLRTRGGAGLSPDEIDRMEVRTLDGQNLVTVPIET